MKPTNQMKPPLCILIKELMNKGLYKIKPGIPHTKDKIWKHVTLAVQNRIPSPLLTLYHKIPSFNDPELSY